MAAEMLQVKPRNFTDQAWQASVRDEQISQIIVKGGAAVGKSAEMKGRPQLANDPQVVELLVKKVRSFRQ